MAERVARVLPRGTRDPEMFIRPADLTRGFDAAGLVPGPMTGFGPRGITRRGDLTLGPLPMRWVIYMGLARKPGLRPETAES